MRDSVTDVGSEVGRELFMKFAEVANGRPVEDVLSACANMIANCLRQNYGKRKEVEERLQALYGHTAQVLLEHYDPTTGHRRSVIPFDQIVRPPFLPGLGDRRKDH